MLCSIIHHPFTVNQTIAECSDYVLLAAQEYKQEDIRLFVATCAEHDVKYGFFYKLGRLDSAIRNIEEYATYEPKLWCLTGGKKINRRVMRALVDRLAPNVITDMGFGQSLCHGDMKRALSLRAQYDWYLTREADGTRNTIINFG